MREEVKTERLQAIERGEAWTPPRPFLDDFEAFGAMRCCNGGCRRPSVTVSYSTEIAGRIALCEKHSHLHEGKAAR